MHIHCLIMLNVKLILSIIRISIINIIRDVHISNMYKKLQSTLFRVDGGERIH